LPRRGMTRWPRRSQAQPWESVPGAGGALKGHAKSFTLPLPSDGFVSPLQAQRGETNSVDPDAWSTCERREAREHCLGLSGLAQVGSFRDPGAAEDLRTRAVMSRPFGPSDFAHCPSGIFHLSR
jgi:hypothetical protein